jgi:hypothetical protein
LAVRIRTLVDKHYGVILADLDRAADNRYATWPLEEILKLNVPSIASSGMACTRRAMRSAGHPPSARDRKRPCAPGANTISSLAGWRFGKTFG